jgi:hypothetical protein
MKTTCAFSSNNILKYSLDWILTPVVSIIPSYPAQDSMPRRACRFG